MDEIGRNAESRGITPEILDSLLARQVIMRSVIDTGVVVSAVLLPRSVPRQAVDAAATHSKLLVSEATVAELDEVLRRPKFDRYVSAEERLEFLAALVQAAEKVNVTAAITDCRDRNDNKFWNWP